jgi:hypothetical protein
MILVIVLDIVVLFPLAWIFGVLWKERRRFHSFLPIIIGVVFLFIARLCEVMVEHPNLFMFLGVAREPYSLIVTTVGGFADVLAVLFLVIGFVQTIKARRAQEKIIRDLESLFPICSGCKKYRDDDGIWHPIEKYLLDSGAPEISHGLCPDCAAEMREEITYLANRRRKASKA